MAENIFLKRSVLEYELPDFRHLEEEHYLDGFYKGTAAQLAEVEAIIA